MNGNNRQPNSLLGVGPLTFTLYADAYYSWQFARPIDHTIFPSTVAPRHDEISINLVTLGAELTGLDGPIGRVFLQAGSNVETDAGQDATSRRGFFLNARAYQIIQQAAAGWHFHALHGINVELGIFPSYVGLESYLPQENWTYTRAFLSDVTPYFFSGLRTQLFLTRRLKLELWAVNGWQTFGQWHEGRALGYLVNWRPAEWLSLTHSGYTGNEQPADPDARRWYSDNYLQLRYLQGSEASLLSLGAISLVADLGYEARSLAPSGAMGGLALSNRLEQGLFGWTVRGELYIDETQALSPQFPVGPDGRPSPYSLQPGALRAGGLTTTFDLMPSPWIVFRVEYSHRVSNLPLFSGHGGITGPGGVAPADPATFKPELKTSDDRVVGNVTLRL